MASEGPVSVSVPHAVSSLSPLCIDAIDAMTERELQDILPQLVATLQQGDGCMKPDWWPHATLPWSLHLLHTAVQHASPTCVRQLVSQCYHHLNQQALNQAPLIPRVPTQPRVLDWLISNPPTRSCTHPAKKIGSNPGCQKTGTLGYQDMHQCCHCDQEFSTPDTLIKHQVQCKGTTLPLSTPSTPPASEALSPSPPTVVSDDTSWCGGVRGEEAASEVSRRQFITALDLVPVHRARKIRQASRRNTECETLDLEEPCHPLPSTTPRTPKLLISVLSRDGGMGGSSQGSCSRRRLSYRRPSVDKQDEKTKEDQSASESEESGVEDADEPKLHKKSLFSIDVASCLGQRVLKHMTTEHHVPVISDSEQFCHTPIKDKYQGRLRARLLSYPITWKLTGKRLRQQSHCHAYNFTRAQKQEFMEKMRTGLNWRCRKLLAYVKKCWVVVKPLSSRTLRKWKPSLNKVTVVVTPLTKAELLQWTSPMTRKLAACRPVVTLVDCRVKPEYLGPETSVLHDVCGVGKTSQGWVQGKEGGGVTDVKRPLQIDIPPLEGGTAGSRSSGLDDCFSIMSVSSSDDDLAKTSVCCKLCAARKQCTHSPRTSTDTSTISPHIKSCTSRRTATNSHSPLPSTPSTLPSLPSLPSRSLTSPPSLSSAPSSLPIHSQPASSYSASCLSTQSSSTSVGSPGSLKVRHGADVTSCSDQSLLALKTDPVEQEASDHRRLTRSTSRERCEDAERVLRSKKGGLVADESTRLTQWKEKRKLRTSVNISSSQHVVKSEACADTVSQPDMATRPGRRLRASRQGARDSGREQDSMHAHSPSESHSPTAHRVHACADGDVSTPSGRKTSDSKKTNIPKTRRTTRSSSCEQVVCTDSGDSDMIELNTSDTKCSATVSKSHSASENGGPHTANTNPFLLTNTHTPLFPSPLSLTAHHASHQSHTSPMGASPSSCSTSWRSDWSCNTPASQYTGHRCKRGARLVESDAGTSHSFYFPSASLTASTKDTSHVSDFMSSSVSVRTKRSDSPSGSECGRSMDTSPANSDAGSGSLSLRTESSAPSLASTQSSDASLKLDHHACSPAHILSPFYVKKRLSAKQMLLILESAKSTSPQGKYKDKKWKKSRSKKRKREMVSVLSLKGSDYHAVFSTSPGKKTRSVD